MSLFKTRRTRTRFVRFAKRMIGVGVAGAALLAGVGIANARGYYGPGYEFNRRDATGNGMDLAVLGYKDGMPVYCLEVEKLFNQGDQNRGRWTTTTDMNSRIAAQMVKMHQGDMSDLTQAAVAYAIHDHMDRNQAAWRAAVAGGLRGANINTVRAKANQFWNAAAAHVPTSAQVRNTSNGLSKGVVTIQIKDQRGQLIAGVPWRIQYPSDIVKIDGPTSGTSTSTPIKVSWHAIKQGQAYYHVQYASVVARQMAAASGNMQPLFSTVHDPQWFTEGTQFKVSPGFKLTPSTVQQSPSGLKVGDSSPVHDKVTWHITKSSSDAQIGAVRLTGNVILHYDGNPYVAASSASKSISLDGASGSVDSPSFTPADLGFNEPGKHGWQAGTYWFDVKVAKQGEMEAGVDMLDHAPSETFKLTQTPPPAPSKKIEIPYVVSQMPDHTVIASETGLGGYEMILEDDFTNTDGVSYKASEPKVVDTTTGQDVSSEFRFAGFGDESPAKVTATYANTSVELPLGHRFELRLTVKTEKPREGSKLVDSAKVTWNPRSNTTPPTPTPPHEFHNHEPKPNKVWVLDQDGALKAEDPDWSNSVDYTKSDGAADNETFLPGDKVAAVVNGRIPNGLVHDMDAYEITDDWTDANQYVDFTDPSTARVFRAGRDVTDEFTIVNSGTRTIATAKPEFLATTKGLAADERVKLVIFGTFRTNYRTKGKLARLTNAGSERYNDHENPTNVPAVFTWTSNPDKAWIRNQNPDGSGKWLAVIDPNDPDSVNNTSSNNVGGDQKVYREADPVGLVVNGEVPTGLARQPLIQLTDDYGKADYVWDPADQSQWRVYDAEVTDFSKSTVSDIVNTGRDVTSQFTFSHQGTVITATAGDAYSRNLMHLTKGRQIVLLVPGKINLANGGGNQQVYKDTNFTGNTSWSISREETNQNGMHGYKVCVNPSGARDASARQYGGQQFLNQGSETAGAVTVPTNTPPICVWVPNNVKSIIAEKQQGGDQHNADSQYVRPGQIVEYNLNPMDTVQGSDVAGYKVVKVGIDDTYDPDTTLDAQTIKVINNETSGKQLMIGRDYTVSVDEANHKFHLEFTPDYVATHWKPGDRVDMKVTFEAKVSQQIKPLKKIDNSYLYQVNNGSSVSNTVENEYVPPKPPKRVTQEDESIDINGKKALLGDVLYYRLGLDTTNLTYDLENPESKDSKQIYRVQRLGMVDDYDDQYLQALSKQVKVLDPDGRDVTSKFNIQDKAGVLYVFAKTVDSVDYATGHKIAGDPQPTDLAAYWKKKLNKHTDPYIDQHLLGKMYQIVLPVKVIKVKNGYVVKNTAIQNVDDQDYTTNEVNNPLVEINPKKDVVVNVGSASANGKDIYLNHYFLYRLDSSRRPTDLAYPVVTDWSIVDKLDPSVDRYTGAWAVYANANLYDTSGALVAQKGEKIAGSGTRFQQSAFYRNLQHSGLLRTGDTQLFTASQTSDGTVTIQATKSYTVLVSPGLHEAAWSAYIQVKRLKPVKHHNNQFVEILNGVKRPSNIVWTRTPDQTPRMRIEKYDILSGLKAGDRNKPSQALANAKDGTRIGLLIENVGLSDLHKIAVSDRTIAGDGTVSWDQQDLDRLKNLTLKPGEKTTIYGTLNGVTRIHTDRATVHSTPLLPCPTPQPDIDTPGKPTDTDKVKYCDSTPISQHDDWNGKITPIQLAMTGSAVKGIAVAALLIAGVGITLILVRRHALAVKPSHKA